MNKNLLPPAQRDRAPTPCQPRTSERLNALIDDIASSEPVAADGRAVRSDGWTPERQMAFVAALAECGVVADAARRVGMSAAGAYNLRRRAAGKNFRRGWDGALHHARARLADALISRAIHGCVEIIVRDGEVWGERHRFDNRHTMAVMSWIEQRLRAEDAEANEARLVAGDLEGFLEIIGAGGEGGEEFLAERASIEAEAKARRDNIPTSIQVRFVRPEEG